MDNSDDLEEIAERANKRIKKKATPMGAMITQKEAEKILNVSPSTFFRMIKDGEVKKYHKGKRSTASDREEIEHLKYIRENIS